MNVLDLKSELEKAVKSVYVISGNDSFLTNVAQNNLKEILVNGFEEFNFLKLDGAELKEDNLKLALNTPPFCASYRLIIINNINSSCAKVINEFAKLDFYNVVVVVVNPNTSITGEVINCDHLSTTDLKKYLTNLLNKRNVKYSTNVIDYIIDISSSDLNYITTELNKVIGYLDDREELTVDIVKLLFTKNESYFVYNLSSAIDNKDMKKAMKILNSLQENISVGEIFTFMGANFRKMFYCAINSNNEEIASILKIKPYAVSKARECVNKNGKSFYVNLYNRYINLDQDIKMGKITPINAIYNLLLI